MDYDSIISEVARDMGLSSTLVDKSYRSYWRAVREYISSLPLKEDLSDEEFLKVRANVNIPSIGKLYVTLDRYKGMKKWFEMFKDNYKGNKYKKDNNAAH
jgi:hypothetical protein